MIDLNGVDIRLRRRLKRWSYWFKGFNFCWYLDLYDKLKKYGLCINGCIDGYIRKFVWFMVGWLNNDLKVIGRYYLDVVINYGGFFVFMRGDMGIENLFIVVM